MGSIRKKTATKPVPAGAEFFTRGGVRFARWKPVAGKSKTAKLTIGNDGVEKIVVESGVWLGKYRSADGHIVEQSTGCKDKQAAAAVVAQWERRVELVKCGVVSKTEDRIADHQQSPLAEHFTSYQTHMQARGRTTQHIAETLRYLKRLAIDCGWSKLSDLNRESFDRWLSLRRQAQMGARNLNAYRVALVAFCNWCVSVGRLANNPFSAIPKADEKTDRRRPRRAMSEAELIKLLNVAAQRPLMDALTVRRGRHQGQLIANVKPSDRERLQTLGRERALIYKTLALSGLRMNELASLTIGQLQLDGPTPHVVLNSEDEKNRNGASLPIPETLAHDLRAWIDDKQQRSVESRSCIPMTNSTVDLTLPLETPLFNVPVELVKIFNRDLKAAGIPKIDDRGRSLDVHALRTTFGTLLSRSGVAPRSAQSLMRHSTIDLTMNVYTDPRLLDLHGAVNSLPELPLNSTETVLPESLKATGTHGEEVSWFPPGFPPNLGNPCLSVACIGTASEHFVETVPEKHHLQKPRNTKQKRFTRSEF